MLKKTLLTSLLLANSHFAFALDGSNPIIDLSPLNDTLKEILKTVDAFRADLTNPTPRTMLPITLDSEPVSSPDAYSAYLNNASSLVMASSLTGSAKSTLTPLDASMLPQAISVETLKNAGASLINWAYMLYAVPNSNDSNAYVRVSPDYDILNAARSGGLWQTPTAQAVFNMLSLPIGGLELQCGVDNSNECVANDTKPVSELNAKSLAIKAVASGILSNLPSIRNLTSPSRNERLVASLNADTLIAPLVFDTKTAETIPGSSGTPANTIDPLGAVGKSQAEKANNFVRYATGQFLPIPPTPPNKYNNLMRSVEGQSTLALFLTKVRTIIAQSSIAISNFNYILGRRIKPPISSGSYGPSQAELEYQSASARLLAADGKGTSPWVKKIQTANPTQLQQETVLLLAEMNYQLYLNRQMQERMLLTLSAMHSANMTAAKATLSTDN